MEKFGQFDELRARGSTLMMCPQGDEQARAFKETLAGVDAWSITGSVLELSKGGKPVATFEAVAL